MAYGDLPTMERLLILWTGHSLRVSFLYRNYTCMLLETGCGAPACMFLLGKNVCRTSQSGGQQPFLSRYSREQNTGDRESLVVMLLCRGYLDGIFCSCLETAHSFLYFFAIVSDTRLLPAPLGEDEDEDEDDEEEEEEEEDDDDDE